jgi:hypothetical protein
MLFNPNSYGLCHRLSQLSDAYEIYSQYVTKLLANIYEFRRESAPDWYFCGEAYNRKEANSIIVFYKVK